MTTAVALGLKYNFMHYHMKKMELLARPARAAENMPARTKRRVVTADMPFAQVIDVSASTRDYCDGDTISAPPTRASAHAPCPRLPRY